MKTSSSPVIKDEFFFAFRSRVMDFNNPLFNSGAG